MVVGCLLKRNYILEFDQLTVNSVYGNDLPSLYLQHIMFLFVAASEFDSRFLNYDIVPQLCHNRISLFDLAQIRFVLEFFIFQISMISAPVMVPQLSSISIILVFMVITN